MKIQIKLLRFNS